VYHLARPHLHREKPTKHGSRPAVAAPSSSRLAKRHLRTQDLRPIGGPLVDVRIPLAFNADLTAWVAQPTEADPVYLSNGDGDDLVYVFRGSGLVRTVFGDLRYGEGDYVCIPRGTVHRWLPDDGVEQHYFGMELAWVGLLEQWRNETGQLRMDAPYCHRDFRRPDFRGPIDEGIRDVVVKRGGNHHGFEVPTSPLDVVGWDGAAYPWVFPILAFQPRVSSVHLPPTWHGTFAARGALVCSFVPRLVDFRDDAIPCPYPHSSVHCDEILFYCKGNFTSRKGVGPGSVSLHPMGIPHGPHPGSYEASIGTKSTDELAVMLDTFLPLSITEDALAIDDAGYMESFR
jgi:homogentisate 1,2-dioxygenase